MTDTELDAMEKGWRDASPGTLRPWVAALLEEVRRLRPLREAIVGAIREEREACARQVEDDVNLSRAEMAAAIRERGKP